MKAKQNNSVHTILPAALPSNGVKQVYFQISKLNPIEGTIISWGATPPQLGKGESTPTLSGSVQRSATKGFAISRTR